MNYNVNITLLYNLINNLSGSLQGSIIFNNLLYQLLNDGRIIGKLFIIGSLIGLPFNLMSGYFADKYKRSYVVKVGAVITIIPCLLYLYFFKILSNNQLITILYLYRILGVIGFNTKKSAFQSLYSDSIPSLERNKYEIYKFFSSNLGQVIGYVINIIFFLINKNKWNIDHLKNILAIGCIVNIISESILFLLNDNKSLDEESEAFDNTNIIKRILPNSSLLKINTIPYIIVLSRLCLGAAGAIMLSFVPILLKQNLGPVGSNYYYIVSLLMFSGVAFILEKTLSLKSQIVAMVSNIFAEVFLLSCLLLFPSIWNLKYLLIGLILLQSILGTWHMSLSESIFMNYVKKENRGKWNSISRVAYTIGFFFLLLAPKSLNNKGFKKIFLLSIILKFIGGLIRSLLLFII